MAIQTIKGLAKLTAILACIVAAGCGGSASESSQQSKSPSGSAGPHVLGDANAKVTVVEYGDFQCPACKYFATVTEPQIISTYVNTGKARFEYRNFPLYTIHQNAQIAAEASECAAKVGGNDAFWKYHDTLFSKGQGDGTGLDLASLKQYAADLRLDTATFNSCLDNHEAANVVSKSFADGQAAGVHATPTVFVNGKPVDTSFSGIKDAIDAAL